MKKHIVYHYPNCSTCRKAVKWLDDKAVPFTPHHIVEETPDAETIKKVIKKSGLPLRKFFNTSGMRYRELGLKDKLDSMSLDEAAALLASDGMLIKRPLVITGQKVLTGFKEKEWEAHLLPQAD